MRIKPNASFPRPVLGVANDYGDKKFELAMSVEEIASASHAVLVGFMGLDDGAVYELIQQGKATAGLMVTCQETYLDRFFATGLGDQKIDLSGGLVRGAVHVRGVVLATANDVRLTSEWINVEFTTESRVVGIGGVIARTEELRFEAGLEKLAPLESIFRLKVHEDVAEGMFELDVEGEAIEILVSVELHRFLSLLRGQAMKDTLLSSLFLPVVMSVLDTMRGEQAYDSKRWHSVMTARCNAEGIDFKNTELSRAAQQLLDSPLGSLQKAFERASS